MSYTKHWDSARRRPLSSVVTISTFSMFIPRFINLPCILFGGVHGGSRLVGVLEWHNQMVRHNTTKPRSPVSPFMSQRVSRSYSNTVTVPLICPNYQCCSCSRIEDPRISCHCVMTSSDSRNTPSWSPSRMANASSPWSLGERGSNEEAPSSLSLDDEHLYITHHMQAEELHDGRLDASPVEIRLAFVPSSSNLCCSHFPRPLPWPRASPGIGHVTSLRP